MLNFLVLAQRIPFPANKGEKIRTFNQVKHLSELGCAVTVFSPMNETTDTAHSVGLQCELDNVSCSLFSLKHKVNRLIKGMLTGESLSVTNFYSAHLQQAFDEQLRQEGMDVVICTSSAMAKYIFCSKVFSKLGYKPKLVMDFMDVDSDKWLQYVQSSSLPMSYIYSREHKLIADYERRITEVFDECYLISEKEVELFNDQVCNAPNVKVLGNGLDTQSFYPPEKSHQNEDPVFIFTGVMDYKPNVDAVVWFVDNCWLSVLNEYPNAQFIIAGMKPSSEVEALTKYKGIDVTGFVDDILPYYHQADYFVAPFRLARGVQNKVLQAFACKLPVLSTPMGAEGINCHDNESILIANTPDEFIVAINQLENDAELKSSIKENAYKLIVEEYSWQAQLEPLKQFTQE
ncbi:TIGR03087 family PEP-CTERM/XrtA system glycosyltransferase [Thalassotalea eurytherma]|nr:TIGR03087 family PEP-CTERM/XrtA system glycosyltransferase [Thalassotalea eurytherma]